MKKIINIITGLLIFVSLFSGCSSKGKKDFKVLKDRVIEFTYNDFDLDNAIPLMASSDPLQGGMCSAVKVPLNGKVYVGRNLDFYCSDSPLFIVRNNSGKYRTVGIGISPQRMGPWTNAKDYEVPQETKELLPLLCTDVLSETGIHCETNIRIFEEQYRCTSTNPGKKRLCTQAFLQVMLSQYSSIQEILEHINDYDWFDLEKMGFHQSFLLTDKNGYSVIVEFAKNKVYWEEADHNANFFINKDLYATQNFPCGELRLEHEYALKDSVKKPEDIFTMMKAGAYDQFYHINVDLDYATPEFLSTINCTKEQYENNPEIAKKATFDLIKKYDGYNWQERIENETWETSYCAVVNVTDLEMNVHFSEHYNIELKVKL